MPHRIALVLLSNRAGRIALGAQASLLWLTLLTAGVVPWPCAVAGVVLNVTTGLAWRRHRTSPGQAGPASNLGRQALPVATKPKESTRWHSIR